MSEMNESFEGSFDKKDRKEFDKQRRKQSEVLGYTLTGKDDIKTEIGDATVKEQKLEEKPLKGRKKKRKKFKKAKRPSQRTRLMRQQRRYYFKKEKAQKEGL